MEPSQNGRYLKQENHKHDHSESFTQALTAGGIPPVLYDYQESMKSEGFKKEVSDGLDKTFTSCSPYPSTSKPKCQTRSLPYVVILEQPISHTRFRFPSEKSIEKIIGENSSTRKKTYPKIQVLNYDKTVWGKAQVVVSCVSHNSAVPFVHPHNLVSPAKVKLKHKLDLQKQVELSSWMFANISMELFKLGE